MNNSKLFDIETTVTGEFAGERLIGVKITAAYPVRQKIWNLVTNETLNPKAAWYDGSGDRTAITMGPNSGYAAHLIANMAYALACLAMVEADGLDLFSFSLDQPTANKVTCKNFIPDLDVVREFQRLYLRWKAVSNLRSKLHNLGFEGLNTSAIYTWHDEAIEALRRLHGEVRNYAAVEEKVDQIGDYAKQAHAIDTAKLANRYVLEAEVASFEAMIDEGRGLPLAASAKYFEIVKRIEAEATRLRAGVVSFRPTFDKIQSELMVEIRKATPPAPPSVKSDSCR